MKRIFCLFIASILIAGLLVSCGGGSDKPAAEIKTYKDIPGITKAEIKEIESLTQRYASFSFGVMGEKDAMDVTSSLLFINENDSLGGFYVHLCDVLSDVFTVKFIPKLYAPDDFKMGLDNEDIQFSANSSVDYTAGYDYYTSDIVFQNQKFYSDFVIDGNVFYQDYAKITLSTASNELRVIIDVFNKYLKKDHAKINEAFEKAENDYIKLSLSGNWTDAEKEFIQKYKTSSLYVYIEQDYKPFSYVEDGIYKGYTVDVLNKISALTSLSFVIKEKSDGSDIISGAPADNDLGNTSFIIKYDHVYANEPYYLVSKKDFKINAGETAFYSTALVKNTWLDVIFKSVFPENKNYIELNNIEYAFDALDDGKVDFVMATASSLSKMSADKSRPDYFVSYEFSNKHLLSFSFTLKINENDVKILSEIFTKALKHINVSDYSCSETGASGVKTQIDEAVRPFVYAVIFVFVLAAVVIIIFILYNKKAKKKLLLKIDRKTAELNEHVEAAEIASLQKSTFLARMSHEIRTPLNAIAGMTSLAKRDISNANMISESLNKIELSSKHILNVVNDILDISKIESGKFSIVNEPFSLHDTVYTLLNMFSFRCKEKTLAFNVNVDEIPNVYIMGDSLRLRQVMANLMSNAIKFTAKGGRIDMRIAVMDDTDATVTFKFSVSDTGIGISDDQKSRLFSAFEQADRFTSIKYGGTGLGLAISKSLVELMGGEISVESEIDNGSCFFFTVTFDKAESKGAAPRKNAVPFFPGKRILIVEDIEINRAILSEYLKEAKVTVEEAEDGDVAVEMFKKSPEGYYDMIFMDLQMPNLDGYATTEAIRALDRSDAKSIPVIALSANAFKEDVDKSIESGMNKHLAKPDDFGEIMNTLNEYLEE